MQGKEVKYESTIPHILLSFIKSVCILLTYLAVSPNLILRYLKGLFYRFKLKLE